MEEIAISKFKATCLAVLERVRKTGEPVRVTRFGQVVAEVVPPGKSTLLAAALSQPDTRPGYGVTVTYRWAAEPMMPGCQVFVHLVTPQGKMIFQGDHGLPVPAHAAETSARSPASPRAAPMRTTCRSARRTSAQRPSGVRR